MSHAHVGTGVIVDNTGWSPILYVGAGTLPAHGVCVPAAGDNYDAATGCLKVTVPTDDDQAGFMVNGETSVDTGTTGKATANTRLHVRCDAADGDPAVGERWGVKAGSTVFRKGYNGVVIVGPGFGGVADALRTVGAAGRWFARLTTASGGLWKYVRRKFDGAAWVDDGVESAGFTAKPSEKDGSTTPTFAAGDRVFMIDSKTPGYQEFMPVAAAAPAGGVIATHITETTGLSSFKDYLLTASTGVFADGPTTYTNLGRPIYVDGAPFASRPDASAIRWQSTDPGYWEYASFQFAGLTSSVYYPGMWSTADGQVFKGDKEVHGEWGAYDDVYLYSTDDLSIPPVHMLSAVDTAVSAGGSIWWNAATTRSGSTFPGNWGISVLPGDQTAFQYGYFAVGLNEKTVVYDDGGDGVDMDIYPFGGVGPGGYYLGKNWQGGDYGYLRVANGWIVGYASGSTAAGQLMYFDGTNWVILDPPASDGNGYLPQVIDGVISWVRTSLLCPSPPVPPVPPIPPTPRPLDGPPAAPPKPDAACDCDSC